MIEKRQWFSFAEVEWSAGWGLEKDPNEHPVLIPLHGEKAITVNSFVYCSRRD